MKRRIQPGLVSNYCNCQTFVHFPPGICWFVMRACSGVDEDKGPLCLLGYLGLRGIRHSGPVLGSVFVPYPSNQT